MTRCRTLAWFSTFLALTGFPAAHAGDYATHPVTLIELDVVSCKLLDASNAGHVVPFESLMKDRQAVVFGGRARFRGNGAHGQGFGIRARCLLCKEAGRTAKRRSGDVGFSGFGCTESVSLSRALVEEFGAMWRSSRLRSFVVEMAQDSTDKAGLGDEGEHAQLAAAGTQKWVELEVWLILLSLVWRRNGLVGELRDFPSSSNDVRVVPIIEQQMSPWLWDLGDCPGQELESVDFFELREELAGVVVRGFGSVENVSGRFGPLQSGKALA